MQCASGQGSEGSERSETSEARTLYRGVHAMARQLCLQWEERG